MTRLSFTAERHFLHWIEAQNPAEESEQLREYQSGDPKNKIHWKHSAKSAQWQVRTTQPEKATWRIFIDNRENMQFGYPQTKVALAFTTAYFLQALAHSKQIDTTIFILTEMGIQADPITQRVSLNQKSHIHLILSDFYRLVPITSPFIAEMSTVAFNISDPIEWGEKSQFSGFFMKKDRHTTWLNLNNPNCRANCREQKASHMKHYLKHIEENHYKSLALSTESHLLHQINQNFSRPQKNYVI